MNPKMDFRNTHIITQKPTDRVQLMKVQAYLSELAGVCQEASSTTDSRVLKDALALIAGAPRALLQIGRPTQP